VGGVVGDTVPNGWPTASLVMPDATPAAKPLARLASDLSSKLALLTVGTCCSTWVDMVSQ
jgi:hypothetical protein